MKIQARSKSEIAELAEKPLSAATIHSYVSVAKMVVASAVNDDGVKLYPREWNHKFIGMPKIQKKEQNAPCFSRVVMTGLANYEARRERALFTLLGATGPRIGEMLGVEVDKHISRDFRTITFEQKVYKGKLEARLKTAAAYRQVDLSLAGADVLREYVCGRKSGFLFRNLNGGPLDMSDLLRGHLHPALKALGFVNTSTNNHKAGNHAFRRYRNTYLRNHTQCPEGLRKFWMGHADEDMGDRYDKICEDLPFRLEMAEKCGLGFDLPLLSPLYPNHVNDPSADLADKEGDEWSFGGA